MRFPFYHPTPPRGVYDGQPFPWPKANIWSKITLSWVTPIFKIALGRTIEDDDPWQVQPDAECRHVAEKIINAHQPRIPPSRRMAGYRPPAPRNQLSGRPSTLPQDRAIIFDHPTSTDSYADRAYFTETLVEAAGNCQLLLNQLDNAVRTSRPPTQFRYPSDRPATQHAASTRRKTVFEPLRNMMTVYEDAEDLPNDEAIADKLAATGSRMQTKAEMVQMYGKRKTAKVLAGKLALEDGQAYNMSLIRACYDANTFQFWLGSGMLLLGFAIRMIIPIITQVIIDDILAVQARIAGDDPARPASLGAIIGLSIGFLALMILCNLLTVHSARVSAILGSKTRAALVYIISKKSMLLSHKSRLKFSAGKINALISADASYAEMACTEAGLIVMCPPVIIIGCALIIKTIGVAGLAGVGVIALTAPIQKLLFGAMIKYRMNHLNALDARTQLLTETVRHLHAIKLFAYGPLFEKRIADLRMEEAEWVKKMSIVFALADIIGTCMPALAAVVSFTIYTATGNTLSLSQAFATLQFFNFVQQPLTWFPRIFSTLANILNASRRLQELIIAEERLADIDIIPQARYAIRVNAGFTHEDAPVEAAESVTSSRRRDKVKAKVTELLKITDKDTKQVDDPNGDPQDEGKDEMSDTSSVAQKDPFRLAHISLKIPHGCLVCIVGRVGSGKSTLLSGLLGETRSTANGIIEFGGSIAYVPQEAWVQSGSIRHNITFAAPSDESRLSEVVRACGLTEDLARLSHGIDTSVGEHGISLSGGQKSRVCLARAAYSDAPIVLLDDPLSAVDASVGHALLNNCILRGPLASRTRVLVTHHLDVLPKADLILVMDSEGSVGRIAQQGTYQARGPFRSLMMEYGSTTARVVPSTRESQVPRDRLTSHEQQKADAPGSPTQAAETMELVEERESGSVAFATYAFWLGNMGWAVWPILLGLAYVVSTGVSIANILWLAYWQQDEFEGLSQGAYQGIYAGIAVAYAATGAACNIALIIWVVRASIKSCLTAIGRVMGAPMWFLDRTPTGRIVSRLTKDIEQMDTSLAFLLNRVIDAFTQPANRDVKRTDAVLRSKVYSNFAEQLNGLSVIRAFQKTEHFELQLEKSVDHQNRFTYLRQYMLGDSGIPAAFLIYGVLQRETINAAQLAVALTLILQSSYVLLDIVPMLAMLEQDMNSVERVKHYCTLEQEAPATKSSDPPLGHWPTRGAISFRDVHLQYRPDLPTVLKGLSFDVREGEKVGVIGRTGAGKSSLVQSLYRTVELAKGSICIDGVNLRDLGLDTLRSRLSLIPQESFLFEGTVRQNIDPDGKHSDAKLNDALSLIHSSPSASESIRDKFRLETAVQADGGNFSAGEKQLLSLIRAMVRDCKVLILDEATSSVDLETDGLIQRIIQTQFADTTLLSIAHRLQTVAYYDKILVMDAGKVAEYDSPLRLYDKPGSIFRRLCDVKGITRQGLLDIRADAARIDLRSRRGV